MAKFYTRLTLLMVVAILLPAIHEAAVTRKKPTRADFKYIGSSGGSSSSSKASARRSGGPSATSEYYLSHNNAEWETADNDCRDIFGDFGSLVNIETSEEFSNLTRFIEKEGNAATLYLVGGKYDTSNRRWQWTNEVPVGPWAPWVNGRPGTASRMSRITLELANNGPVFRSQFNTVAARYICEIKLEENFGSEPEPCYDANDLVIAIDSSGSIGADRYGIALEFAARLAYTWADNSANRVSVLIYSSTTELIFPLNNKLSQQSIRDKIYSARYFGGGTASHLGLDLARKQFEDSPRAGIPKNIVFMTDGGTQFKDVLPDAVDAVKKAEIRTFSVGIGYGIVPSELLLIAQDVQSHVFTTDQFHELLGLLRGVSRAVCVK